MSCRSRAHLGLRGAGTCPARIGIGHCGSSWDVRRVADWVRNPLRNEICPRHWTRSAGTGPESSPSLSLPYPLRLRGVGYVIASPIRTAGLDSGGTDDFYHCLTHISSDVVENHRCGTETIMSSPGIEPGPRASQGRVRVRHTPRTTIGTLTLVSPPPGNRTRPCGFEGRRASATPAGKWAERPCQESNLVFDLRRVACRPSHSKGMIEADGRTRTGMILLTGQVPGRSTTSAKAGL